MSDSSYDFAGVPTSIDALINQYDTGFLLSGYSKRELLMGSVSMAECMASVENFDSMPREGNPVSGVTDYKYFKVNFQPSRKKNIQE